MSDFPSFTIPIQNVPHFTVCVLGDIDAKVNALIIQMQTIFAGLSGKTEQEVRVASDELLQNCQREAATQIFAKWGEDVLPPESPR
jgi:hypothetical protein